MTESERLPEGMSCRECGYCVGGLPMGPCPECGAEIGTREIALDERVRDAERAWPALRTARLRQYGVVIPVYALGAGVLGWHWGAMVAAFGLMSVMVAGSWSVGWLATRMARHAVRSALFANWVRCLPVLHGPWLVAPLCAAIALVAAMLDRSAGTEGTVLMGTALVGLFLWGLGCFGCLVAWADLWGRSTEPLGIRIGGLCGTALVGGMLATLGFSVLLGFGGGVMAAGGVASHVFE
ncbi:MAG TPA: hypothetical protein PLU35_05925 [Phycisphaerales bacterium]|nr:hypothetical protein [Phycisphaerales bacterium]